MANSKQRFPLPTEVVSAVTGAGFDAHEFTGHFGGGDHFAHFDGGRQSAHFGPHGGRAVYDPGGVFYGYDFGYGFGMAYPGWSPRRTARSIPMVTCRGTAVYWPYTG
jgi:hypothetical protein